MKKILVTVVLCISATGFAGVMGGFGKAIDAELFLNPFVEGAGLASSQCVVSSSIVKNVNAYVAELTSSLAGHGRMVIVAPASFGVLFTDGSKSDVEVKRHIDQVLTAVGSSEDPGVITKHLAGLNEVMRATFVRIDGRLQLVTDERSLTLGQAIWCKTPQGVA